MPTITQYIDLKEDGVVKSSRFNSRLLFASIKRLAAKSGVLLHMSAKWGQKFSVVESKSSLECGMSELQTYAPAIWPKKDLLYQKVSIAL